MAKREAAVVLARCPKDHKTYGIRMEHIGNMWHMTWAFPLTEQHAKKEHYEVHIDGGICGDDSYPGCPFCGSKTIVICSCAKLSCKFSRKGVWTCGWCGAQCDEASIIEGYDGGRDVTAGDDLK